ncbi:MAG TPA: purine-nucleoside phosphorylase [Saprospiraceae bacterium]|nr:purine-nucleoside phosphorylase [Saprospiraceae bacterium]
MPIHTDEYQLVQEAASAIKRRMPFIPKAGIILGTGLGGWVNSIDIIEEISTSEVPHLVSPKVVSHKGRISFAVINDVPVAILAGRIHYYEGHEMNEVVRPVRVLREIGCTHLVTTNAAGGLNPAYNGGDIVIIKDHINLMGVNPLRGPNEEKWGPRFPDMMHAYDRFWMAFAKTQAEKLGLNIHTGVYAGNAGPSLETPAEYEYLHRIGADLVGMSAVPEVIAAHHIGLKVLAISVVSNVCYPPERIQETSVEDVIRMVETSAPDAGALVQQSLSFCIH